MEARGDYFAAMCARRCIEFVCFTRLARPGHWNETQTSLSKHSRALSGATCPKSASLQAALFSPA